MQLGVTSSSKGGVDEDGVRKIEYLSATEENKAIYICSTNLQSPSPKWPVFI